MALKTKILFVDNEPAVIQSLERSLRMMRQEWDMEFVSSGAGALALMEQTKYDVIVADLHMPRMDGLQLLSEVMDRYPEVVRFIRSDPADLEIVHKSAGATHQFVSKRSDVTTLKATVLRACKHAKLPQSEKLKELLAKIHRVPSIPWLYVELVELVQDPKVCINDIGSIIGKDMAMTAITLKLVNSAYFGLRRRVSNTTDATIYLGVETIRSLVLSLHVFSQFESSNIEGFSVESLWLHSLETAAGAKTIAHMEGVGQVVSDEAFVAGMLHDIGKLVLAANFTKQYQDVIKLVHSGRRSYCEAEREIFGANHADVGGRILSLWGLPAPVVEAISLHHDPARCEQKVFSPLTAVHAANALVRQLREDGEASGAPSVDLAYLAELGLSERIGVWREALLKDLVPK
jgi:putative nucleotidyltransferase with HDIG domain